MTSLKAKEVTLHSGVQRTECGLAGAVEGRGLSQAEEAEEALVKSHPPLSCCLCLVGPSGRLSNEQEYYTVIAKCGGACL